MLSFQYIIGSVDAQAELSARSISGLVMANPKMWIFEQVRLSELLERRPLTDAPQMRRIYDSDGVLVAESTAELSSPTVARSRPIFDAGSEVGRIEIAQSLRPLVNHTAALELVALAAGALLFFAIRLVPLRVIEESERSVAEGERRYRALFETMREGVAIFAIDSAGGGAPARISLVDANPAWKTLCGGEIGMDGAQFLDGALERCLPDIVRGAVSGQGPTFHADLPDSQRVLNLSVFYPKPGLVAVLADDQTAVRDAQRERERLQQRMLQAQKMESLGLLAGGIAHDFNNLLVGILGNIDLALLKVPADSAARPYLQRLETASRRAADLTNQMLAYSGRGRFVVEPVDLSQLVGELAPLLGTVVSKEASVRYDMAGGLPPVKADATQVRQIVMNLITNASDALADRGGEIRVSTGTMEADRRYLHGALAGESLPAGRYVYVEVADNGLGMDKELQARIFDPFFTTKEKGRGLGLAAVLGIVRGHTGALDIRSAPGEGTTFRVLFPVAPAMGAALPAPPATEERAKPAPAQTGTILVVDDEESVRAVAREILIDQGFSVLTAADGEEGVAVFRQRSGEISAVLLDMTMPRLDGKAAFRQMQGIAPTVPVILCSGYSEQETIDKFSSDTAAGFLKKPYRASVLLQTVRDVLQRGAEGRG